MRSGRRGGSGGCGSVARRRAARRRAEREGGINVRECAGGRAETLLRFSRARPSHRRTRATPRAPDQLEALPLRDGFYNITTVIHTLKDAEALDYQPRCTTIHVQGEHVRHGVFYTPHRCEIRSA